jgi:hypothetical protein
MPPHHEVTEFWLKVVGVFVALIALTITWRTHAERATFEMIDCWRRTWWKALPL